MQCYFERPSAIASLSEASATGFKVTGSWRQQFDWAVVEWNRDNVIEHPALRCLPDGDLSGVVLSYEEERTNCIPLDSKLFPTVDWPYLRIWDQASGATPYFVRLMDYATPVAGAYAPATCEFELTGTITGGDVIELAWLDEHFNYFVQGGDTLATAAAGLATNINNAPGSLGVVTAVAVGAVITLTYDFQGAVNPSVHLPGHNANRVGVYAMVFGAGTEVWSPASGLFSGGTSPTRWKVDLDFGSLLDKDGNPVPVTNIRKMRWTWAADLLPGSFVRGEFAVTVAEWSVTGTALEYQLAGPGSRRVEDDNAGLAYSGAWSSGRGNFSGGSIHWTQAVGASVSCTYKEGASHTLYLGTRRADNAGGQVTVVVDGGAPIVVGLHIPAEDVLVRVSLGVRGSGQHTVVMTHSGAGGSYFYIDFLEIAYLETDLPVFELRGRETLATDWDTDHSLAIAPERTAWLIHTLGFRGRANHYVGALLFYELVRPGNVYASGTITFSGTPQFGGITEISIGATVIQHLNLIGDTAATVATAFALVINAGSTGVWASASGAVLTITARAMGTAGNSIVLAVNTFSMVFTGVSAGMSGGVDGAWVTDLAVSPKINRACRDWTRAFLVAMDGYGIDVACAFSMELQHGSTDVGLDLVQRYPSGAPVLLNTPAVQTNFGAASTAYWKNVHRDMAAVMDDAGVVPYLQFGEVQWWYFPDGSGMPFYDAGAQADFAIAYGHAMGVITSPLANPASFSDEVEFLAARIGVFTNAVMAYVRATFAAARFEVLYPPDVNDTDLMKLVNFPTADWTPAALDCLKTENFTYTGNRNLNKARESLALALGLGFARSQASHLVGIGDYTTPWVKERWLALAQGFESAVLFALDQFCLVGYGLPLNRGPRRALYMGN